MLTKLFSKEILNGIYILYTSLSSNTDDQSSETPKGELSLAFMKGSLVLRVVDLRMELEAWNLLFRSFPKTGEELVFIEEIGLDTFWRSSFGPVFILKLTYVVVS